MDRNEVFRRIANIQAELAALMAMVSGGEVESVAAAVAAVPAAAGEVKVAPARPKPVSRKLRWRYLPGTWYRIVGRNPFRNGNNYNLFEYMQRRYQDKAWSREELGEAIEILTKGGRFSSVQTEDNIVLVFLRTAGPEKGVLEMADARPEAILEDFSAVPLPGRGPKGGSASAPARAPAPAPAPASAPAPAPAPAPAVVALPPEPTPPPAEEPARPTLRVVAQDEEVAEPEDDTYQLLGEMPFRSGVNTFIWQRLGNEPFRRSQALRIVDDLLAEKAFESIRSADTIVRDFLGRVQEKGRLRRF